jgi:hypothetical protein
VSQRTTTFIAPTQQFTKDPFRIMDVEMGIPVIFINGQSSSSSLAEPIEVGIGSVSEANDMLFHYIIGVHILVCPSDRDRINVS